MKKRWRDANRISFLMQMIASILILLGVSAVLIRVYYASIKVSKEAKRLNTAVYIARESAEYFAENGTLEAVTMGWASEPGSEEDASAAAVCLYFDEEGNYISPESYESSGGFEMKASIADDKMEKGILRTGTFSVSYKNQECFSLDEKVYLR